MTPEELAMLTDEERAGLEEDLDENEGDDEQDDDAGGDDSQDDNNGDDAGAGDDDGKQPGRDDGKDDDGKGGQDDKGGDQDDEPADDERPVPLMPVKAVEDAEEKLADIDKREDEISQKFEDGDMTTAEYRSALRGLEKERGTIERQQLEADFATRHNEAQLNARWEENVKLFLGDHPEISKSQLRWNGFDAIVRSVTAETMKDGKSPGMADLKKAYKQWADEMGLPAEAEKGGDDKSGKDGDKPAKQQKKPQRELPPNLAKVPAADIQDTDNGRWANLDRLMESDPQGFEAALAKLSDADQEAYLASQ